MAAVLPSASADPAAPVSAKRRLLMVALVIGLCLVGVLTAAWGLQRTFVYFPDRSDVPPADQVIPGARDVTLTTSDGLDLGAWFVPADEADGGPAVLMAPGNGGNRAHRAGLAEHLSERGFAVLLMDYRGYGGNPGRPSEDGLHRDAVAALDALAELGYGNERVILFGESLGTGVVAGLLAEHEPAGVVLRSPLTELADVGRHHYPFLPVRALLWDRFPVRDAVASTSAPVTVIYGDADTIVPGALSAEVAQAADTLVEELVLTGVGHNDAVMFGPQIADAVARLAATVQGGLDERALG